MKLSPQGLHHPSVFFFFSAEIPDISSARLKDKPHSGDGTPHKLAGDFPAHFRFTPMLGGNEKAAKRSQVHGVRRKDTDEEECGWVITYSHSCSIFPRHKNVSFAAKVLIVARVSFPSLKTAP